MLKIDEQPAVVEERCERWISLAKRQYEYAAGLSINLSLLTLLSAYVVRASNISGLQL